MSKIYKTASDLKNNTASILNDVMYGYNTVIIQKHGQPVAQITAINNSNNKEQKMKEIKEKLIKYTGTMPDFPSAEEIENMRKSSDKDLTL